ncbi:hypothetical protein J14TS5_18160 [Paenibacillus lautus]|uniref:hypothetical protein n=1 Tax=Paenibacillus lautus TaxID=1401 RepID=UPI001B2A5C95|nr:hypothetical protein [Paenibacillus lautus]GIO96730.1 hypothetical protein J14TS5_18160 [Paenibacillus lautus]
MIHSILNAAHNIIIHDISCCPNDKEIPQGLIKNNLWGNPGIGAANDDSNWFLFGD